MCHGFVYTGSSELDYPRTLRAALHVHRIEIPYRAFPERVGPRILSLESVDYFGTTDHFSGRKKKKKNNLNKQNFTIYLKIRIEDREIMDRGSVKKNLKINLINRSWICDQW